MGQHYIPQYYLEGFTESPDSSNIWVYEKGNSRIFRTSTKTAANENNRWPKSVEDYLANQIEAQANPVLDKTRNRQPISQSDKEALSDYMIVMLQRVPRGLEKAKEIAPEVRDQVFENVEKEIKRLIKAYPSKKSILQNRLEQIDVLKLQYENEFPMEVWYQIIKSDALPQIRAVLPTMTWVFFVSSKKQRFLTNDNPIFFFEGLGIGKPESEITFPLSSNVTLWATWLNSKEGYSTVKDVIVREINRRTASAATRYVYYSEKAQWVVNLANKKKFRLNKLK